jgi:hypothetical protein
MSAKTCRVIFNFPGPGVVLDAPPSTGANDSRETPLHLELKPGENVVPLAAAEYWLAPGRLKGVRSKRVNGAYVLSVDEQPLTREQLNQRRAQLERDRIALERDQLALDRERLARKRRR